MVSQFADYNLCEEELNNFEREKRFFRFNGKPKCCFDISSSRKVMRKNLNSRKDLNS